MLSTVLSTVALFVALGVLVRVEWINEARRVNARRSEQLRTAVIALQRAPAERDARILAAETAVDDIAGQVRRLSGRVARFKQLDQAPPAPATPADEKAALRAKVGLAPVPVPKRGE